MKTVIIEYAKISPAVLTDKVRSAFPTAFCIYKDIDEDFFEFSVYFSDDLEVLEDILAEYV